MKRIKVMKTVTLIIVLMFLISSFARAESVRLYEWNPGTTLAPLVIAVKQSETPEQAAQRYLNLLMKNPDLAELFLARTPDLPLTGFTELNNDNRESRALLMANLPKDYTKDTLRVVNFQKVFAKKNHQSYILPINAGLGLSQSEDREFKKLIAAQFPFLVAMGGDDVEPELYKKPNFHSRNTIPARDYYEASMIKSYVAQEKGFLLGVCRGSQISSVALGYEMIQDVPFHIGTQIPHGNDWHDIEVKQTPYNILGSVLKTNSNTLYVNSLHHQSVKFKEGGMLVLAATSGDGVTEATEFKNGRGVLLQFHPELMSDILGNRILWKILEHKNTVMPPRCSRIF